jgi:hypothetical protein
MSWRRTLIALVMVACASGTQRSPHKMDESRGDMDTFSALKKVCDIMTRDPLSPAAARDALGRSTAAWLRTARVVAAEGDAEPNHVGITLPSPLPQDAFEHAFGPGREAPMLHPDSPTEVLYYPEVPTDRHHTCAVIARLEADGIRDIAVRRDPRL